MLGVYLAGEFQLHQKWDSSKGYTRDTRMRMCDAQCVYVMYTCVHVMHRCVHQRARADGQNWRRLNRISLGLTLKQRPDLLKQL